MVLVQTALATPESLPKMKILKHLTPRPTKSESWSDSQEWVLTISPSDSNPHSSLTSFYLAHLDSNTSFTNKTNRSKYICEIFPFYLYSSSNQSITCLINKEGNNKPTLYLDRPLGWRAKGQSLNERSNVISHFHMMVWDHKFHHRADN